jgi:hypothetical protein
MPGNNHLAAVSGFVAVSNSGPDGFAVGGSSRESAASVRTFSDDDRTVTNIERARWIAREFHGWDVPSEEEVLEVGLAG